MGDALLNRAGALTFGLVFVAYSVLYVYLSGMLIYHPVSVFPEEITFLYLYHQLNPPGDYLPFVLFPPNEHSL